MNKDTALPDNHYTTEMVNRLFEPFAEKMQREGLPPIVIKTFRHYFSRLVHGETGLIFQKDIEPVEDKDIARLEELSAMEEPGQKALEKAVIVKLNGGLGTSMGLSRAKSLLEVKKGLNFLDITARQVISYRKRLGVPLPVVFMNSFNTEADTLNALATYPGLATHGIPLSFKQHKFPKVLQDGLLPAAWAKNPDLEWNPPGHGDIYTALVTSGMLEKLLASGAIYAFVSNCDNLGAVMDQRILGYFAKKNIPFLMEVTDRTEADSKGGHLARMKGNGLILREIAQCPDNERDDFQNVSLYKYFNTNSIWINLPVLAGLVQKNGQVIPLSMIRNCKTLDPRDESTPPVYQLETAMGSAISMFEGAEAVRVPRTRFAPVKKCHDLLAVWSDAYALNDQYCLISNPKRRGEALRLRLDEDYYQKIDDLKKRFPHGAPSLLHCTSLTVVGDVVFGQDVTIKGRVVISNHTDEQVTIEDGKVIEQDLVFT
jgi:UTP--glucose-1-phosphate uridylyltransferase